MDTENRPPWLLLIHQLPPKPDYLRVKTRRRLIRLGAIAIKNTVYALPNREAQIEDFHWLLKEIEEAGGEAYLCAADMIEGMTNSGVMELFNQARNADFTTLTSAIKGALREAQVAKDTHDGLQRLQMDYSKFKGTLEEYTAIDYFGASKRVACELLLGQLGSAIQNSIILPSTQVVKKAKRSDYLERIWMTRSDVFVDRIASAWLIRRYIDTNARFKFTDPSSATASTKFVRFDMFDADFTHVGDHCTFEVLMEAFSLDDPALREIGEIVHDLDLKDAKFQRNEASGLEAVFKGLVRTHPKDPARIDQGMVLMDALYAQFTNQDSPHGKTV